MGRFYRLVTTLVRDEQPNSLFLLLRVKKIIFEVAADTSVMFYALVGGGYQLLRTLFCKEVQYA